MQKMERLTFERELKTARRADPALLKALARAFRWRRLLDEGRYSSLSKLAAAERIERGNLGRCCG